VPAAPTRPWRGDVANWWTAWQQSGGSRGAGSCRDQRVDVGLALGRGRVPELPGLVVIDVPAGPGRGTSRSQASICPLPVNRGAGARSGISTGAERWASAGFIGHSRRGVPTWCGCRTGGRRRSAAGWMGRGSAIARIADEVRHRRADGGRSRDPGTRARARRSSHSSPRPERSGRGGSPDAPWRREAARR